MQRAKAGELRMYLGSWGSYSINDVSAILPNFFDGGADDYARDADVVSWLDTYVTTYGFAKQLDFTPYADELPRYFLAKWK